MTSNVGWFGDVLDTVKRFQQLHEAYSVHIVSLVNVYIEVAAHNDWTSQWDQLFKHTSQFVEECSCQCLAART